MKGRLRNIRGKGKPRFRSGPFALRLRPRWAKDGKAKEDEPRERGRSARRPAKTGAGASPWNGDKLGPSHTKAKNRRKNMKRKIAIVSLVAMMLITAVGYASLQDRLTATGTATTGTFDVQFVDTFIDTPNIRTTVGDQTVQGGTNPYDALTIDVHDMLPDQRYTFTATIKNTGSYKAKFVAPEINNVDNKYFGATVDPKTFETLNPGETQTFEVTVWLLPQFNSESEGLIVPYSGTLSVKFIYGQEN
jgi:hypothetical protein